MTEKSTKTPERSEIPVEMTWDISVLYANTTEWEKDFSSIKPMLEDLLKYRGKLKDSAKSLNEAFKKLDDMNRLLYKIYVFAHLRSDEDTGNAENLSRLNRIKAELAVISGQTAWVEPEILAIPEDEMDKLINSDELEFYKRSLQELLRKRPHTLSEKEERILGMSSDVLSTPQKTFSLLSNADMRFPQIEFDGMITELTHGNFIKFMESNEREIRRQAYTGMYETHEKFKNTFSSTLDGTVKTHVLSAKLRDYPSAIEAALFPDNVPLCVYENLIKTVHDNLPSLHSYFDLRTKVLKLDKLEMYDIYNPLVAECNVDVDWKTACKWVQESLDPMGEEYCSIVKKAFNERWIDVLECRGKRSGAYSSGCYDSLPYILMNYSDTLNDVFTLAHELGHSMHSYHSIQEQEFHYADYRIFVAEVASTTNELLLHHYLMEQATDKNFKNYLLNHLINQIRGTIYRQTMFAEFEKLIHDQAEQGIPLTHDLLCNSYAELNAKYHGDSVAPDKLIAMEWSRIPHFYYNFYVYKYATGLSAAAALSQNILSGDKGKLDAYIGFLKAGDTKDVLDILKDAGVDLSTPAPIEEALKLFDTTLEELKQGLL